MSKRCPPAGSGRVNSWTWATACEGKRPGRPPQKEKHRGAVLIPIPDMRVYEETAL
jgi:hypothetical protein